MLGEERHWGVRDVLGYAYTSLRYAQQISGPGAPVYWTANARDAELRLTQQTAGPEPVEGASSPARASTPRPDA
jgi:hypothetical protein